MNYQICVLSKDLSMIDETALVSHSRWLSRELKPENTPPASTPPIRVRNVFGLQGEEGDPVFVFSDCGELLLLQVRQHLGLSMSPDLSYRRRLEDNV